MVKINVKKDIIDKKSIKNPKNNTYQWVKIGKRRFCTTTKHRVDPDGYRLIKKDGKLVLVEKKDCWYYRKNKKKK